MAAPTTSWARVRVHGTWFESEGTGLKAGKWSAALASRVTNSTDDAAVPAGPIGNGTLAVTPGSPSFDQLLPCTDDPDNEQTTKVVLDITFDDGSAAERYVLDVPYANRPTADGGNDAGVNLRTVALATPDTPAPLGSYMVGVPGGLAKLNSAGQVVDATGTPITGGGGGGGTPGADGASAYEIAVAHGYPSDEATWLASLHGAPGADSTVPGPPGVGLPGPEGPAMAVRFRTGGVFPARGDTAPKVWATDTAVAPPDLIVGDLVAVYDPSSTMA